MENANDGQDMNGNDTLRPELEVEKRVTAAELEGESGKPTPLGISNELDSGHSTRNDLPRNEPDSNRSRPTELDSNPGIVLTHSAAELEAGNSENKRVPAEVAISEAGTVHAPISPVTSLGTTPSGGQQHFPYTPPMDLEHGYCYDGTPGTTSYQCSLDQGHRGQGA